MTDLRQLAEEIGSFSSDHDLADQRYRFQEMRRFAHKIQDNCLLAIKLIQRQEQERDQLKLLGDAAE